MLMRQLLKISFVIKYYIRLQVFKIEKRIRECACQLLGKLSYGLKENHLCTNVDTSISVEDESNRRLSPVQKA